jgi:transcriptional regulator with XRE-family HTH domain
MKPTEKKLEFIRLRAEGKSYRAIETEIGVSRSTCSEWERELSADIARLRHESLEELYSAYGMAREARIRRLGDTLQRIDEALEAVDFSQLPPERLLDLKLKYTAALKDEYTPTAYADASGAAEDTLNAIQDLYRRTASGETTTEQAKTELNILDHMVDGYNRANPMELFGGL